MFKSAIMTPSQLSKEVAPRRNDEVIWDTRTGEPELQIIRGSINLIACARIESNIKLGVRMTLELAARAEKDQEGFYVQTDDGEDFYVKDRPLVKSPRPIADLGPDARRRDFPELHSRVKNVLHINTYSSPSMLKEHIDYYSEKCAEFTERRRLAGPGGDSMSGLPCQFLMAQTGTWDQRMKDIEYSCQKNGVDVLILNAFEFAGFTAREKHRVVRDLVNLRNEYDLTIVVLTTEVRFKMAAGVRLGGPIGMMTVVAESFWIRFEEAGGEYSRKSVRSRDPKLVDYERPRYTSRESVEYEPNEADKKRANFLVNQQRAQNAELEDVMEDSPFTFAPERIAKMKELGVWAD